MEEKSQSKPILMRAIVGKQGTNASVVVPLYLQIIDHRSVGSRRVYRAALFEQVVYGVS